MSKLKPRTHPDIYAHGGDEGLQFILPSDKRDGLEGGILRRDDQGHLVTMVGRGGTGKTILALQLMTQLLADAAEKYEGWPSDRKHGAFYFTLEATPFEIYNQLAQFSWGKRLLLGADPDSKDPLEVESAVASLRPKMSADRWSHSGLHVISIPSPAEDLTALILQVRQTIARELFEIGRLTAIGIDPLGGINLGIDLRNELSHLKNLATSHRTFVFLLTEDHIFEKRRSIEHYSQTVMHLRHDPRTQPYRKLYIQKSRGQRFRSGHHQFDLDPDFGVRVFPSVQAQSAFAHDEIDKKMLTSGEEPPSDPLTKHLFKMGKKPIFDEAIKPGSVIFLMGPPGTFKQVISTNFVQADTANLGLYISFKADIEAVRTVIRANSGEEGTEKVQPLDSRKPSATAVAQPGSTLFLDARNPLATPEEILSQVREAVMPKNQRFRRAVVWGLRRLNDMPNFAEGKAVQFLEALVTLLKSRGITSILVDWPDIEKASTLPVVDLSQYILLTRVCEGLESLNGDEKASEDLAKDIREIWSDDGDRAEHVALLRLQRTAKGFHRNLGVGFRRTGSKLELYRFEPGDFERFWFNVGIKWEKDPGLVH